MKIKLPAGFFPDKQYVAIVAIDPGKTIGVATTTLVRMGNKQLPGKPTEWDAQFVTETLDWPTEALKLEYELIPLADVLVVEDWRLRKDMVDKMVGQILWGPEVIGFIKGVLSGFQSLKLQFQTPADKEGIDGYIRKRVDWPVVEHERDALRHLVRYLLRAKDLYR